MQYPKTLNLLGDDVTRLSKFKPKNQVDVSIWNV